MKIKTTNMAGDRHADIRSAVLQSFGKAFLLPVDVILGWLFTNDKRQRIFSRLGNTIVIRLDVTNQQRYKEEVNYRKE